MYTLKYNGQLLHDPRTKDRFVRAASFRLVVGEAGSGTFTVDSTNPALAALRRMSGQVELLQDGSPIYRGRILRDTTDFYQSREIVTEGAMAYLNDSLVPPFNYPEDYPEAEGAENTVAVLFNWFLDIHNASVSEEQQIKPGVVTVTDPNNYIARSSDKYLSTIEAIRTRLVNTLGGYLLMRYEPDGNYLDYYAELPLTNTQPIRYGQNLLDLVQECDGSEIYTAILPSGANDIDISGELDGDITPDLVKEGKIIYSRSGREQFGNITRLVEFQDVTEAANLKSKAARQLALGFGTKATITCQAADLGFTANEIPNFRVGRNTFVYSNPHGLSAAFPLMEMELDISNPGATPITLGGTSISFTGNAVNDNRDMAEAMGNINFNTDELDSKFDSIAVATQKQITDAVQNSQSIIFAAMEQDTLTGDFTAYQQTVSTQMQLLSDSLTISISNVASEVTRVEGDTQAQITDITKYFRFTDNGLFIGELGNEVLLQLDSDTIASLRNNYAELWLDPGGIHADNIEARRVQSGNFEIIGESDGRLSFRKAVN